MCLFVALSVYPSINIFLLLCPFIICTQRNLITPLDTCPTDTIIYEIELSRWPYIGILGEHYTGKPLEQFDDDGCDTGLLYETVTFFSDPNVAIHKGNDTFTRVDNIENPVITTTGGILW